jgi:SAM-dependent methyltransferase
MLNAEYWESRYQSGQTGWDIGMPSPALTTYFEKLESKDLDILIPGAGKAHDLQWLHYNGFTNSAVLDISKTALQMASELYPEISAEHFIEGDFFSFDGAYDLIVEQTFFCALDPKLRPEYARKMHSLLKPGGCLMGLLFDFPLTETGPPFGGSVEEYQKHFSPWFSIKHMERAHNSIKPRAGKELFFKLIKK